MVSSLVGLKRGINFDHFGLLPFGSEIGYTLHFGLDFLGILG